MRVVAAALYDAQGRVLIAERPRGTHMAGRWEFPGGKVTPGEEERAALVRELAEELGIEVWDAQPFMRLTHAYPDRDVELSLWIIACSYLGATLCLALWFGLENLGVHVHDPNSLATEIQWQP